MASEYQVKQYLAYWFLLGKKIVIKNGSAWLLPKPVFRGERFSLEFEECWQLISAPDAGDCYLEGTNETISQLLSPAWDLILCARCQLPIPLPIRGLPPEACPCFDLLSWPNSDLPPPRVPVNNQAQLRNISERLNFSKSKHDQALTFDSSPTDIGGGCEHSRETELPGPLKCDLPHCRCSRKQLTPTD